MTTSSEEGDTKPNPREPWTGESPKTDLEREDERWSPRAQAHDWLILLLMMIIYLLWVGIIYFLEPGIR